MLFMADRKETEVHGSKIHVLWNKTDITTHWEEGMQGDGGHTCGKVLNKSMDNF